jgi:hypothetical protein
MEGARRWLRGSFRRGLPLVEFSNLKGKAMPYDYDHYDKFDPTFEDDLKESETERWMAARWLSSLGHTVLLKPLKIRPQASQMSEYVDDGDIHIVTISSIKGNQADIVIGYLIFNSSRSNFCKIRSSTKKHWTKRTFPDKKVNRIRSTYTCPMEYCQFYKYEINL